VPLWVPGPEYTLGSVKKILHLSADGRGPSGSVASGETMTCADLDSLRANYSAAVDEFTRSAKNPRPRVDSDPKAKVEAARRALRNHIIEHDCC